MCEKYRTLSPEIPGNVPRLRIAPGIRDTVHAGTERDDRKIFQELKGRVRLVEEFSFLRGSKAGNQPLDPLVQRGKAPSISWVPFPEAISAKTSGIIGLISGEQYTKPLQRLTLRKNPLIFPSGPGWSILHYKH